MSERDDAPAWEVGPRGKIDGGPACRPCSCGEVGRYAYGSHATARCHNPACPVIVYHATRTEPPPASNGGRKRSW